MNDSCTVANEFVRRLINDEIKKDYLPCQGEPMTKESVKKELEQYQEFLKSDFFKEICKM